MTYAIALPGVDIKNTACFNEYPVEALYCEDALPDTWSEH